MVKENDETVWESGKKNICRNNAQKRILHDPAKDSAAGQNRGNKASVSVCGRKKSTQPRDEPEEAYRSGKYKLPPGRSVSDIHV